MIAHVIRWSVHNRFLVLLATVLIAAWGVHSLRQTPLDAFPDLSDTQVIVKASYPGKAPQIVEDQVTYPLTTTLLGVPGAKPSAHIRRSATRSSTCCSTTAPIRTGRVRACSNT